MREYKGSVLWATYYFTHPSSYYHIPENDMPLSSLSAMEHLKPKALLSKDQEREMHEWAQDYGKCVRQRSARQQTTMYNTGTLPLNIDENATYSTNSEQFTFPSISEEGHKDYDQVSEYDSETDVDDTEEMDNDIDTPECLSFRQPAGVGEQSDSAVNFIDKINIYTISL